MRRSAFFFAFTFLCSSVLLAQSYIDISGTPNGIVEKTDTASVLAYEAFSSEHIGRVVMTGQYKWFKYRAYGTFGPALSFPLDGVVDNVVLQIYFSVNQPSNSAKIVYLSSSAPPDPSNPGTAWTLIGSGSEAFGTVTTTSTVQSLSSTTLINNVAQALRNRESFYLGFISNQEASATATNTIGYINLHVGYHRVPSPYFVKNILNAGRIKVDGLDTLSGTKYMWLDSENHSLEGINQYFDPYNYVWHTTGMTESRSNWFKAKPNDIMRPIPGATGRVYTYVASKYDSGASIYAGLKKTCNISLRMQSDAGDIQDLGVYASPVENDTVTITAPATMTVGGNAYPFANWADASTQRWHQFTVTVHTQEVAIYSSPYPSGTLPYNTVWPDTKTLAGDVTVPSGVTLTIKSSATVNLNAHSIISTGGTITLEVGAAINGLSAYLKASDLSIKGLYPTIQSACNNASDGNVVDVQSGTFTENVSVADLWGFTLQGQGSDQTHLVGGITANSVTYLTVQNLSTTRQSTLNYCDGATLLDVDMDDATHVSEWGLNVVNCLDFGISGNSVITEFYGGLYLAGSADAYSWGSQFHPNTNYGVASNLSSYALLYSSLFCGRSGSAYDLSGRNGGYVESDDGTYVNATPRLQGNAVAWGSVNNCPLLKGRLAQAESGASGKCVSTDSSQSALSVLVREYHGLKEKYDNLKKATDTLDQTQYRADHLGLIDQCKAFMVNNPSSPMSATALTVATHSFRRLRDYDAMRTFVSQIAINPNFQVSISPTKTNLALLAKREMMDAYRGMKNFDGAISLADEILQSANADTGFICEVIYAKGLLYAHQLKKVTEAAACFTKLISSYPSDFLVGAAQNELRLLGEIEEPQQKATDTETLATTFGCQGYPSPFNPSTTISYQLPVEAFVTIKVYDILGRDVTELARGYHKAGRYSIVWDATRNGVSSGAYFVRFTASDEQGTIKHVETAKVLLMK